MKIKTLQKIGIGVGIAMIILLVIFTIQAWL